MAEKPLIGEKTIKQIASLINEDLGKRKENLPVMVIVITMLHFHLPECSYKIGL